MRKSFCNRLCSLDLQIGKFRSVPILYILSVAHELHSMRICRNSGLGNRCAPEYNGV